MSAHFVALPTDVVSAYQRGHSDAYGLRPEVKVCDGEGFPCRHCLAHIDIGDEYLVLAHRPFSSVQPYAETGPIFLHARPCDRYPESARPPTALLERAQMIVRGYGIDERIVYGTGRVVETAHIAEIASRILDDPAIAFVDVRSASNNCFFCRVVRAQRGPSSVTDAAVARLPTPG